MADEPYTLKIIEFHSDTIFAVERAEGIYVAVKPISDSMGLNWKSQHRRLSNDKILSEGMVMVTIPSVGGAQETTCLRLEFLNGWLFRIDASRVKDPKIREKVLVYQREGHRVLFEYFFGKASDKVLPNPPAVRPFAIWTMNEVNTYLRVLGRGERQVGVLAASLLWEHLGFPMSSPSLIRPHL